MSQLVISKRSTEYPNDQKMVHANTLLVFYIFVAFQCYISGLCKAEGRHNLSSEAGGAFLMNLYRNNFDENGQIKTKNASVVSKIIHVVQGKVDSLSSAIRFEMRGINPKEVIQKAEIRVKVSCSAGQHPTPDHPIRLGLYDRMTAELISETLLKETHPTWVVFPVDPRHVAQWLTMRPPSTNREVIIEKISSTEQQKNLSQVLIHGGKNDTLNKPFMVVYTDGESLQGGNTAPFFKSRTRRDSPKNKMNKEAAAPGSSPLVQDYDCSKHSFVMNTKDIFGSRAIAPLSFNAYDCAGKCVYNAASHQSFNNHAIVRSLAVSWERKVNITTPCCVPTSFHSLTAMLYYEKDHVVLRRYPDMVAKECGCR